MSIMVISCKRVCMSAGHHAHAPTKWVWYLGGAKIKLCRSVGWAPVCSFCRVLHLTLLLLLSQFGLPISEQVAKIHRRFAVCSCILFIAVACVAML